MPPSSSSAIAGLQTQSGLYPFQYLIDALSQTGGSGTITDPLTGNPTPLDFTGLGTADIQNQTSAQMAQTLLNIQQTLGPDYVKLALDNLKQSDPTGYAAYNQVWEQIQQQAAAPAPGIGMSEQLQGNIQSLLGGSQELSPSELSQVQQGARSNNVASGIYLGNAPAEAEGAAVVGATDKKQQDAQNAAGEFLAAGISPADLQYQQLQQDMANYGAFINGQSPTNQIGQLQGGRTQAAPYPNTGFSPSTLNLGQGGEMGINNAQSLSSINNIWNQNTMNPYLAGLNLFTQGVGVAGAAGAFGGGGAMGGSSGLSNAPINVPASGPTNYGYSPTQTSDWSNPYI